MKIDELEKDIPKIEELRTLLKKISDAQGDINQGVGDKISGIFNKIMKGMVKGNNVSAGYKKAAGDDYWDGDYVFTKDGLKRKPTEYTPISRPLEYESLIKMPRDKLVSLMKKKKISKDYIGRFERFCDILNKHKKIISQEQSEYKVKVDIKIRSFEEDDEKLEIIETKITHMSFPGSIVTFEKKRDNDVDCEAKFGDWPIIEQHYELVMEKAGECLSQLLSIKKQRDDAYQKIYEEFAEYLVLDVL